MAEKGKKVAKKVAKKVIFSTQGSSTANGRLPRGVVTKPLMVRWPVAEIGLIHDAAKKAEITLGAFIRESVKAAYEGRTFSARKAKASFVAAGPAPAPAAPAAA